MKELHDERYTALTEQLVESYSNYSFRFLKHYSIYGQEVQLFYYEKASTENSRRRASGVMLTFNGNPGDILWNIQNDTKEGIVEILRIHNRIGRNPGSFSTTLFKGPMDMGKMEDHRSQLPQLRPQKKTSDYPQNNQRKPQVYVTKKPDEPQKIIRNEKPTSVTMEKFKELAMKKGWIKEK